MSCMCVHESFAAFEEERVINRLGVALVSAQNLKEHTDSMKVHMVWGRLCPPHTLVTDPCVAERRLAVCDRLKVKL